ncbi:hypothetical protein [Planococcus salinus]|uniref:hypothetical protein n=1 Tax=Planococcus salinus TaxID=1848460 RepID=UPI001314FEA3|nr:hypothetical protein [Planococcus salinus]
MANRKKEDKEEQQETEFTGMPNEQLPDMESDRSQEKAKEQSDDDLGDNKENPSG